LPTTNNRTFTLTTLFFNISGGEIFIILLVIFIFFGPDKIPEIARWLGKSINEVKKATSDIRDEITRETTEVKKNAGRLSKDIENAVNTDPSAFNNEKKQHADPATEINRDKPNN
jgi:sec-independent protein translocase protein TatA